MLVGLKLWASVRSPCRNLHTVLTVTIITKPSSSDSEPGAVGKTISGMAESILTTGSVAKLVEKVKRRQDPAS